MTRKLLLLVLAALVALPVASASAKDFTLTKTFSKQIAAAKKKSKIDVLVPTTYSEELERVYPSSYIARGEYSFSLASAPGCGGATACYLGSVTATKGGTFAFKTRIKLADGITGRFKNVSCGASCSPAFVQFRLDGVLYELSFKTDKAQLVRMANEMITEGPR